MTLKATVCVTLSSHEIQLGASLQNTNQPLVQYSFAQPWPTLVGGGEGLQLQQVELIGLAVAFRGHSFLKNNYLFACMFSSTQNTCASQIYLTCLSTCGFTKRIKAYLLYILQLENWVLLWQISPGTQHLSLKNLAFAC